MKWPTPLTLLPALASAFISLCLPQTSLFAQTATPAEPKNAGVSIWTQNVTGFRKEHGAIGGYTTRWDLSDLPSYVPQTQK